MSHSSEVEAELREFLKPLARDYKQRPLSIMESGRFAKLGTKQRCIRVYGDRVSLFKEFGTKLGDAKAESIMAEVLISTGRFVSDGKGDVLPVIGDSLGTPSAFGVLSSLAASAANGLRQAARSVPARSRVGRTLTDSAEVLATASSVFSSQYQAGDLWRTMTLDFIVHVGTTPAKWLGGHRPHTKGVDLAAITSLAELLDKHNGAINV